MPFTVVSSGVYPALAKLLRTLTMDVTTGQDLSITPFSPPSASVRLAERARDKRHAAEQHAVVPVVVRMTFCLVDKVLRETQGSCGISASCAQGGFSSDVGPELEMMVSTSGRDRATISTEAMFPERCRGVIPSDVLVGVSPRSSTRSARRFRSNTDDELLQRIRDQGFQTSWFSSEKRAWCPSIPAACRGEAMRGQQLQTFDLARGHCSSPE